METRKSVLKYSLLSIIAGLMFMLSSCETESYYDYSLPLPEGIWAQDSSLVFNVPIDDTTALYDFFLNLRHRTDYPYANLYLFIRSTMPDSTVAQDTLELQLAQTNGKWLGSGNGSLRYNHFILRHQLRFAKTGNYQFEVTQGMRQQQLIGIENVGIQLINLELK